jgi:hypothetical protein
MPQQVDSLRVTPTSFVKERSKLPKRFVAAMIEVADKSPQIIGSCSLGFRIDLES